MNYSTENLVQIGGNNQKVYRSGNNYDSVIKVLNNDFRGDSPHKHWKVDERIDACVNAYREFPEFFPETEKIADDAIRQDYFSGGINFGKALENNDYTSLIEIFGNLKKVHSEGYIHADLKGDNLSTGKLSVDTETFGKGDYMYDLSKGSRIAAKKGRSGLYNTVISDVYGDISLN